MCIRLGIWKLCWFVVHLWVSIMQEVEEFCLHSLAKMYQNILIYQEIIEVLAVIIFIEWHSYFFFIWLQID